MNNCVSTFLVIFRFCKNEVKQMHCGEDLSVIWLCPALHKTKNIFKARNREAKPNDCRQALEPMKKIGNGTHR